MDKSGLRLLALAILFAGVMYFAANLHRAVGLPPYHAVIYNTVTGSARVCLVTAGCP